MDAAERPPIQLQASVAQTLVIELEAMPGAALVWSSPAVPDGCTLTRADSVPDGSGIGGPVRQRFMLVCGAPGRLQLRFELGRPWERVVRAVQPVEVEVR